MIIHLCFSLFSTLAVTSLVAESRMGWTILFDGNDLSKFRCYQKQQPGESWKVENGIMKFKKKKNGAEKENLITIDKFQFFDLRLDWMLPVPGNSGIIFRVAETDGPPYKTGPEMQIFHQMNAGVETDTGSCYGLYPPEVANMNPVGQWNKSRLLIKPGNRVSHFLNGELLCSYLMGGDDWKKRVENSKFKNWEQFGKISRGHICLQDHGSEIWFRNIRLKRL